MKFLLVCYIYYFTMKVQKRNVQCDYSILVREMLLIFLKIHSDCVTILKETCEERRFQEFSSLWKMLGSRLVSSSREKEREKVPIYSKVMPEAYVNRKVWWIYFHTYTLGRQKTRSSITWRVTAEDRWLDSLLKQERLISATKASSLYLSRSNNDNDRVQCVPSRGKKERVSRRQSSSEETTRRSFAPSESRVIRRQPPSLYPLSCGALTGGTTFISDISMTLQWELWI